MNDAAMRKRGLRAQWEKPWKHHCFCQQARGLGSGRRCALLGVQLLSYDDKITPWLAHLQGPPFHFMLPQYQEAELLKHLAEKREHVSGR